MTTPTTPAADLHKFGAYADKIGHWTDGPETFVICKAKNVQLGAQTYGPPLATARESALVAERDALRAALVKARDGLGKGLWDFGPGQDEHEACETLCEEIDAVLALSATAVEGV